MKLITGFVFVLVLLSNCESSSEKRERLVNECLEYEARSIQRSDEHMVATYNCKVKEYK
jgi:hypothetical protein